MMSRAVCKERAKLRKDYLPAVKAKTNVQFAFIPWSVPVQVLYKEDGTEKLKSCSTEGIIPDVDFFMDF